jgi:hypothetical protein
VCHRGSDWSEATYASMNKQSKLSHWGWSHNWGSHSFSSAWLHKCQCNSQDNSEDDQEDIEGWLTLATPSNCKENSEEYTQTSQQHFKVNVHFIINIDFS